MVRHEADRPERSRVIHSAAGEYLNSVVLPHPEGKGVFTNVGGTLRLINGSRKTSYEWDEPIVQLGFRGNIVYGIDVDGALIIWNAGGGEAILRVYFFDDGGWIALPPGSDRIWASPGAIEKVVLYRDGRPVDPRRVSYSRIDTSDSAM